MNAFQVTYGWRTSNPFPVLQYYWDATKQVGFYPAHNLFSNGEYTAESNLVAIWRVKPNKYLSFAMPKAGRRKVPITYKVDDQTGCWNCDSHAPDSYGYPRTFINGKNVKIFRMMHVNHNGEIPEGKLVRHTCDNRKCINPAHLLVGTIQDNTQDKIERGRHNTIGIGKKKKADRRLNAREVLEIRSSGLSRAELIKRFNVSRDTIRRVVNRETWKGL